MQDSSDTLTLRLKASLLREQVTDLILLAVLAVGKELRGEEQNSLVLGCLRDWSAASARFLQIGGYPAAVRQSTKAAVSKFLDAHAGVASPIRVLVPRPAQPAGSLLAETSDKPGVVPSRGDSGHSSSIPPARENQLLGTVAAPAAEAEDSRPADFASKIFDFGSQLVRAQAAQLARERDEEQNQ